MSFIDDIYFYSDISNDPISVEDQLNSKTQLYTIERTFNNLIET